MADLTALRETRWPAFPTTGAHHTVSAALVSREWTGGRYTREAEAALCELTGAPHAVAFQSCTAALHAALIAHGARHGTPLHTPAFGFAGTLIGASHVGMRLLYHDVDPDTGNSIDPEPAPGILVLTPDLHGVPHTLDRTRVITDACQSLGTLVDGRHVGARGTHCWSFSASKLVSAPDGGAVTTDNAGLADDLRQLRDYGAEPGPARANALITQRGHNWRPSELSMALVTDQLRTLPALAMRARMVGTRLQTTLAEAGLWHQQTPAWVEPAWHKIRTGFYGRHRSKALRRALDDVGMPWHDWGTIPLPEHPVFHAYRGEEPYAAVSAALAASTFCLGTETCPPWTWTDDETDLVCATLEMITETL
ncbi:UDP-4-amino-4-deoxy-L-arabinose--oxoglutarate aminotransferase [Streptomyces sp. 111WW2]|uniref:DegT/DnrJ/EryC1/StrS family aminotransferase n=1 Tax=Streptomyces sp. 111WW2 TaxID=1945515 RepID=UPI000D0C957E|nr:DegT/DnrJ/EryC1/StrS family aminotransferase [Streptomyces sp. 111WW2]PSK57961.1 UDP-4-amino-4-deoxy-L-arabinose--oxoglutarate aminotransferase [Streptomyces sp. 111WW2]